VFKYILISIVIVPVLLGVKAADGRGGLTGLRVLRVARVLYGSFWLVMLYIMKYRWVG